MSVSVAIIGVHGIGKTATAAVMEGMGYRYVRIEAIEVAQPLYPTHRQIVFFSKYVSDFITHTPSPKKPVVFDSHPLVVLPYTEWWLKQAGEEPEVIEELLTSFETIVSRLPKVTLLVYLKPERIETVVERIKMRSRFNSREELNEDYIRFIDLRLKGYVRDLGRLVAEDVITIRAEDEMEIRARKIDYYLRRELGILPEEALTQT